MNIKIARSVHLYLGCFFAPLLTIFIITGVVQIFNLHEARKNGYKPPVVVGVLVPAVILALPWLNKGAGQ